MSAATEATKLCEIEYCIFDVDGLLIDSERIYTDVTNTILAKYGCTLSWEVKSKIMGKTSQLAAQYIISQYPALAADMTPEQYLTAREAMQNELWPKLKPMKGAAELVKLLHANKIPIALATGSHSAALLRKTSHLPELFDLFPKECVLTADSKEIEVGRGKPCPDIFLAAARALGRKVGTAEEPASEEERLERQKGLVFEDALPGLEAGRRAGMQTVWVPDEGLLALSTDTHRATYLLKSLDEFETSLVVPKGGGGSSTRKAGTGTTAAQMDAEDPLAWTRDEFEMPLRSDSGGEGEGPLVYLCGNSLGLLPKSARKLMIEELDVWSRRAVSGHFDHPHNRPWKSIDETVVPGLAEVVGAKESEVAHSSTLTSNIHSLFVSFYRPTARRWRIVIEKGAFPSDWYAVHSHPPLHAAILSQAQIDNAIIPLSLREGEDTLRTEDIVSTIKQYGDEIALVWLSGVQYYTGQYFEIPPLSKATHEVGALFGLDLAHAVGNVPVKLNEWDVDFAAWCTYKYLNAGPGAVAGYYIRDGLDDGGRRLAGWWGQNRSTRFQMGPVFDPIPGAAGYQHSNPPLFSTIPLIAHLDILKRCGGIPALRAKSIKLTGHLHKLLTESPFFDKPSDQTGFRILTPSDTNQRGCQLSLLLTPIGSGCMGRVFERMIKAGVVGDERQPDVIRLSPVPLYNSFRDVELAVGALNAALAAE